MSTEFWARVHLPPTRGRDVVAAYSENLIRLIGPELETCAAILRAAGRFNDLEARAKFVFPSTMTAERCREWLEGSGPEEELALDTWIPSADEEYGWHFDLYVKASNAVVKPWDTTASLHFGNMTHYSRGRRTTTGVTIDGDFLLGFLERIALAVQPDELRLLEEGGFDFPLRDAFIFHRDPVDHLRDLEYAVRYYRVGVRERIHHGNEEAAIFPQGSDASELNRWSAARSAEIYRRLDELTRGPLRLDEWRGRERELVEDALLACEDSVAFFEADPGAFGVVSTRGPCGSCEEFYLQLLERIARER